MKLTIPVSKPFHQKLTKFVTYLGFAAYIGLLLTTIVLDIQKYLEAQKIGKDMVVVDAALTLDNIVEENGSKGRTYNVYHYTYAFEVNGHWYSKQFSVAESNLEDVIKGETIPVGYAKANPSVFNRLDKIEQFNTVWKIVKHLLLVALVAAIAIYVIGAYIVFGLFTPKKSPTQTPKAQMAT